MRNLLFFLTSFISFTALSQTRISISNDISVMRNMSKDQKFWVLGHCIAGNVHILPKVTAYTNFTYYTPGKFTNQFTGVARSGSITPQTVDFEATARWLYRQVAFGVKYYFIRTFEEEVNWAMYGQLGIGLMWAEASNSFFPGLNPAEYATPVQPGDGSFSRLNIDLTVGWERPLGGNFFVYLEGRTWVPTTDRPSGFIHNNSAQVPLTVSAHIGLRILFGY